jgi:predicted deacylase
MRVEPITVPAGAGVELRGRRYHFPAPGPRVLLTGGLHGNEVNAVAALWHLEDWFRQAPLTGTVTVLPCVNAAAVMAKTRRTPGEDTDLNRFFPGRPAGYLAERVAAALVALLDGHDALIDVHTTGWCVPHVLLDATPEAALGRRLAAWAAAAGWPVVRDLDGTPAGLQGLDRSWTAAAVRAGKPAVTVELPGFLTLQRDVAQAGAEGLGRLLQAAARPADAAPEPLGAREEIHGSSAGLFEACLSPGTPVTAPTVLGVIRALDGTVTEEVRVSGPGLLLVLQTGSAVAPGAWLATLAGRRRECVPEEIVRWPIP